MLRKIVLTSVLASSTLAVMTANAALPSGLYVSGQVGYADTNRPSTLNPNLANDGLAGRLAIGYKLIPSFAVELGYLQLPTTEVSKYTPGHFATLSNQQHAIDVVAGRQPAFLSNACVPALRSSSTHRAPSWRLRGFPTSVEHMGEGENGMTEQHPRSGVTHHFPNPFACRRFVAMYRAVRAGGFVFIERAVCDSLGGILCEFRARGAQPIGRGVIGAAEESDHALQGPALAGQPACFRRHACNRL